MFQAMYLSQLMTHLRDMNTVLSVELKRRFRLTQPQGIDKRVDAVYNANKEGVSVKGAESCISKA